MHRTKRGILSLVLGVGLMIACGPESGSQSGPIAVAELALASGQYASFGKLQTEGDRIGVEEVNAHGGVLGQKLQSYLADSEGDAVKAVTALRSVLIHNPKFLMGPTSIEFDAIHQIVDSTPIVDFTPIGAAKYDTLGDKYVYRISAGDTPEATTMAFYAITKGLTKCAFAFENTSQSQALIPLLTAAYTRHGGTVVANVQLVPSQASYSSEVVKAFQNNPQCLFGQMSPQTAGTFFANLRTLKHFNVPFIGSLQFTDPSVQKAIGADPNNLVTAVNTLAPSGAAFDNFTKLWKVSHSDAASSYSAQFYDGVIIGSLAMTAANSTDPKVWVDKITAVSGPPGTKVYTYEEAVRLLKAGTEIDYEGASGNMNYNNNHNVFTDWQVVQASGSMPSVMSVPATSLIDF